jgi:hypothetical protein
MAAGIVLRVYNSGITSGGFLKKVLQHHPGLIGAAQNMDLFLHTRPHFVRFYATGRFTYGVIFIREEPL